LSGISKISDIAGQAFIRQNIWLVEDTLNKMQLVSLTSPTQLNPLVYSLYDPGE
jgi:hypothetical protein